MTNEMKALYALAGSRKELYRLELLYYNNTHKADLELIDGTITLNSKDNVQRMGNFTFKYTGNIDYLNDKVKAYMGVLVDNDVVWYPLGVYLFISTKINKEIVSAVCYDGTMQIKQERELAPKLFIAGMNYGEILKYFLVSSGINKINIEPTLLTLTTDTVADYTKNKLEWFNYFADQCNYDHLETDLDGYFTSNKYVEPSPANVEHSYKDNQFSVLGTDHEEVMDYYNIPNVVMRVVNNPSAPALVSVCRNTDPASRFSIQGRKGHEITDYNTVDNIASQVELDNLTRKIVFNAVQVEQEITFYTLNMPNHSSKDIIELQKENINGIFVEQNWTMRLKAGELMKHTVKRLVRLDAQQ
ncbi:MAG: hypothetical protein AB9856_20900 [Cellulosilyticaceae bacterium]